jgi:hypothetical protein
VAAASVASAIVLARSTRSRKVLGIPVRSRRRFNVRKFMPAAGATRANAKAVAGAVNDAAKRADRFGKRVSRVAGSVQRMNEAAQEGAKEP